MGDLIKVATKNELQPGSAICVEHDGNKIAVFNAAGSYYAIEDSCTHVGGSLSEGECDGKTVICPWHGARFDLTTGEATGPPASEGVRAFRVVVEGEEIKIET